MVASQAVIFEHGPITPSAEEVRRYLSLLLGRTAFNASERNRRFLSYVVEETLAGRADRIKAYSIALAAFDRPEEFDPLTDPIVRIEASRLRRSLEHYYLTAGRSDDIRIDIPKGSYIASFSYAAQDRAVPAVTSQTVARPRAAIVPPSSGIPEPRRPAIIMAVLAAVLLLAVAIAIHGSWDRRDHRVAAAAGNTQMSIVVVPFEHTDGDPGRGFAARGLTYDVIAALTQLSGVTTFAPGPDAGTGETALWQAGHDYRLFGAVHSDARRIHVTAILSDGRTGQFLQSWSFERDFGAEDYPLVQADIARQLVAAIIKQCANSDPAGVKEPSAKRVLYDCRYRTYLAAR